MGGSLNVESVLALQPDLVMVSANPGGSASYQPLINAGIPVVVNAEWQEASPLGKAEWVKLLAVLLGKEAVANERFAAIATTYDSLAQQVPPEAVPPPGHHRVAVSGGRGTYRATTATWASCYATPRPLGPAQTTVRRCLST